MNTFIFIFDLILAFCLGGLIAVFIVWLIFIGIPWMKEKKWEKFEKNVVYVVKKNFDRPMNINKEFIKDIIREMNDEQKKP